MSASKYLDHIYGYDSKYKTRYNKRRWKTGRNVALKDKCARENAEAEGDGLMTTAFITEAEVKSTKKKLEPKTRKNEQENEHVSLWQFIEENLLSRERSNADKIVSFRNCKNGENCSRRKLSFSRSATQYSSQGTVKDAIKRCDEEKRKSLADVKRSEKKLKKKENANSNGIQFDYQSQQISPVLLKVAYLAVSIILQCVTLFLILFYYAIEIC